MREELSLFNAMDGNLLDVSKPTFDQSLTMNLLFQERVLVNETMFFNSHNLALHLKDNSGRQSLFEAACKQGLVVPALRGTTTLEEAFQNFPKIYGKNYDAVTPEMKPFRDNVIAAVDIGIHEGRTKVFAWPELDTPLSVSYLDLLKRLLQKEEPPSYVNDDSRRAQLFTRVWSRTRPWRWDLIDAAVRLTELKGAAGLQRAEIFNLLGRTLGGGERKEGFSGKDILLSATSISNEDKLAASLFIKWCTQCHHVNQASRFGVSINFPAYNLDQDFVLDSILRSPLDRPPEGARGFRCEVLLPSLDKLASVKPDDLLAIRADLGHGYIHALKRWYSDPSEQNQDDVQTSLKSYCHNLTKSYENVHVRPLEVEIVSGITSARRTNLQSVGGNIYDLVAQSHVPIFHQAFSLGTKVIRAVKTERLRSQHEARNQELEITLAKDVASI